MVSFITPPVALGSFVAARIAGAPPLKVGLQSMHLGSSMYFVPFFFVLNPALILRGEPGEILFVVATAFIGILLIASALEGYLVGFGTFGDGPVGWISRVLLFAGGIAMALPGGGELGLSHVQRVLAGLGLALGTMLLAGATRSQARPRPSPP